MAGQQVIPKAELPFRTYEQSYSLNPSLADASLELFTKNTVVDAVEVIAATLAGSSTIVRLVNVSPGQTLAAAIAASQYITGELDLVDGLVVNTATDLTVSTSWNTILAGGRLAYDTTAVGTSLVGFLIKVRFREYEG